jgi:hypothetical protein
MIYNWNPLVNQDFNLEGDYGYKEGYLETLSFDSGKEHTHLKNSYVPRIFPALSLDLDNEIGIVSGPNNTEFKQFIAWYEVGLRYGSLPFYANRILFRDTIGIYKFIPESLQYTEVRSIVTVNFGLEEIG